MIEVSPQPTDAVQSGGGRTLALIGFSARALAQAAAKVGAPTVIIDHFADHDCQQITPHVCRIGQWGEPSHAPTQPPAAEMAARPEPVAECVDLLQRFGRGAPILLGGGTENWPRLIDALHQRFTVLGPTSAQLALLRSVDFWRQLAGDSGLRFPPSVRLAPAGGEGESDPHRWAYAAKESPGGNWLWKPNDGAGGTRIRQMSGDQGRSASDDPQPSQGNPAVAGYWQKEIAGRSLGVHCVVGQDDSRLLGVTESLSRFDWPGPSHFIYRGSWGPIAISAQGRHQMLALCELVRMRTAFRGWLQIDLVEDPSGQLWLLELNPRWAAGMEVLVATGLANPVSHHLAAWNDLPASDVPQASQSIFGKAIYYADRDVRLTKRFLASLHALPNHAVADLPAWTMASQTVRRGHPILTLKAQLGRPTTDQEGKSALLSQLASMASQVERAMEVCQV